MNETDRLRFERLENSLLVFYREHICAKEKGATKCAVCKMMETMTCNGFSIPEEKKPDIVYCSRGCGRNGTIKEGLGIHAIAFCRACYEVFDANRS